MKILLATGLFPPEIGGPATYAKLLEEQLPARGVEVEILKFSDVRHLPPGIRHALYLIKALRRGKVADIIFVQDTVSTGFPAALAAWFLRKPLIVRVPGDYAWEQGNARFGVTDSIDAFQTRRYGSRVGLLRAIQKFVVRRAETVIAPSDYLAKIIRGWKVKNIRTIYNGVELPIEAKRPDDEVARPLIVSIGRLVPWKGFAALIDAVAQEPTWHLAIIGDGPERNNLQAQIEELGATDRIGLLGTLPREVALGYASIADVFALYSNYEGLSHTLIEAASLGVAIVASDIPANREVIDDQKNGVLVPLENSEALHGALKRVIENKNEAQAFGLAAAERAKSFSFEATVEQTATLIKLCAL